MKGQHLFVRTALADDSAEIARFYSKEKSETGVQDIEAKNDQLIGKVVGQIVAHLRFSRRNDAIRIEHLYVARSLRRKRVGRFMVSELERIAGGPGVMRLEAPSDCTAADFFRTIGFAEPSNDTMLIREISSEGEM